MSANLQTRLDASLNEILKTSGYIFEIINNNKKQSNLITGPNNQLIQPFVIQQLNNQIGKFDEILDETVSKFNDAKWCVATMVENKQKQEELKLKEEMERQKREAEAKRLKEEMEAKRKAEEEAAAAAAKEKAEREARLKKEQEEKEEMLRQQKLKEEEEAKKKKQQEETEAARLKQEQQKQQEQQQQQQDFDNFDEFIGFDINDMPNDNDALGNGKLDDDLLADINYDDLNLDVPMDDVTNTNNNNDNNAKNNNGSTGNLNNSQDTTDKLQNKDMNDNMDLDMNNLLGNDELILDGLNMSLLDGGLEEEANANNNNQLNDEFDVDNFLNQFGN